SSARPSNPPTLPIRSSARPSNPPTLPIRSSARPSNPPTLPIRPSQPSAHIHLPPAILRFTQSLP
ncbi:MAG: hypothetical protein K1X65_09465, partial [Caldilineales bacterium]|nr:hypothetical protein [Caldilineales bacterium]